MKTADFLFELQCEELPPAALNQLRHALASSVTEQLSQLRLNFANLNSFASPRRLALVITGLESKQTDQTLQKRGPALNRAFNEAGEPTKACIGFAKSCGIAVDALEKVETEHGAWVFCKQTVKGKETKTLMAEVITQAIKQLPVPKWMHWGSHPDSFARPVHHVILLFNGNIIKTKILGVETGRMTVGHRFLCKKHIVIKKATQYKKSLRDIGFVIADYDERKQTIRAQIDMLAKTENVFPVISNTLLEEVTGLVEWPTARIASFNKRFLNVPTEALISAMQDHQKSFPVTDENGKLLEKFIFISNIAPKNPQITIQGNEKVMGARLSDAEFFYLTDLKTPLADRVETLKQVTFQKKLGTLHDKVKRLERICLQFSNNDPNAGRAGLLAKADLLSDMVFEFTDLQGTMGYYYAKHDKEALAVCQALKEQYLPRFSDDAVATTHLGILLSIADKIDNLVASFGMNQIPTGNKDPFALRRAALGVIRTLIENQLFLNIDTFINFTVGTFDKTVFSNQNITADLLPFFHDRFRATLKEKGIALDIIDSVLKLNPTDFYEAYQRIEAVKNFTLLPEAESLAATNKRVANILQKNTIFTENVDTTLFEKPAESTLYEAILEQEAAEFSDYTSSLKRLATLRPLVDQYFEDVMVNVENEALRANRLSVLLKLRKLFLAIADIAYLQKRL